MRYLFAHWDDVAKKLKEASHRLLLFDFDGTLAGLQSAPGQARLGPAMRSLLRQLVRRKTCSVGIISGRSLKDIQKRISLRGVMRVGNHGLEYQNGNGRWVHPVARRQQEELRGLSHLLRRTLRSIPGALLEDKGVSLSVHYRLVELPMRRGVGRKVLQALKARRLTGQYQIQRGNHVLEIRPRVHCDKGTAVKWLLRHQPKNTVPFYAGDDRADEEAFRVVRSKGIAVRIGAGKVSQAPYYLRRQREMRTLLERLVTL